ncbi:TetR/AcrR family transcriptional regulator C-terminal domain-containing protein [Niveispirillum irakense]|uniref:TetR/AcrR family transcriptional regulator C-terminal domain-containing protein n=1 Tax=Niveispirillum irakense TaxID=34011 RepID=UPI00041A1186|nr:TetR/AcrR family transcriptional regulator C-terminal domain-containing protein [Niveispirillum irakense]
MRITREQVTEAALALLDEVGLEGLTMRRLAQALNIQAPSLYWHFKNKEALIDHLADRLLDRVCIDIDPAAPWRVQVEQIARQLRQGLLSRRDGGRLYAGTYIVTPNILRVNDGVMGALVSAGFSAEVAAWANGSLFFYVIGFTIEEQGLVDATGALVVDLAALKSRFAEAAGASHPRLLGMMEALFDTDLEARFQFGLDMLLDGLARQMARE